MNTNERLETTYHAIRTAQNWTRWGRDAATRYAAKRGVSMRLVVLARQLEAVKAV